MSSFATLRRSVRWLSRSGAVSGVRNVAPAASTAAAAQMHLGGLAQAPILQPLSRHYYHHLPNIQQCRFMSLTSTAEVADIDDDDDNDTTTTTTTTINMDPNARHFADLKEMNPRTLAGLEKQGIKTMTEIQAKTWDAVFAGKDVLGRSRTGSGKTLAFLLPSLERILADIENDKGNNQKKDSVRILVISPTRELANQIHKTALGLSQAHKGVSSQVLYGGVSKGQDLKNMDRERPTILTATPGRLMDHLETSYLSFSKMEFKDTIKNVDVLVLDEMDRLLDMGFKEDVRRILNFLPPKQKRQTLLFSATVPESVQVEIQNCLQKDHDVVDCIQEADPSSHTVNTVQQSHVVLPPSKGVTGVVELIQHLQQSTEKAKIIVFFNTTSQATFFASLFKNSPLLKGSKIFELHSKLNQNSRGNTSERFRRASSGVLFTTDVSARGVDYPNVTHVLQIGSATDRETYIHRLGRTARAGKSGEGILVLLQEEVKYGVLKKELHSLDIPKNTLLQQMLDSDNQESSTAGGVDTHWLQHALHDVATIKKAEDCYRSLFGFYMQHMKKLGSRRAANDVVGLINSFADHAGLKKRPGISARVLQQFGCIGHPELTVRGGGDFDRDSHGGSFGSHRGHHGGGSFHSSGSRGGGFVHRGGGIKRNRDDDYY